MHRLWLVLLMLLGVSCTHCSTSINSTTSGTPLHIIIEGWRFLPHSYSVVCQFVTRELLKRPDEVQLWFRDAPPYMKHWVAHDNLHPQAEVEALQAIPPPPANLAADAVLRFTFPFRLLPHTTSASSAVHASKHVPTLVFGTTEFKVAVDVMLGEEAGAAHLSVEQRYRGVDRATTIVAPSQWAAAGFRAAGVPRERVAVIPHGVDTTLFRPLQGKAARDQLRQSLGIDGRFVFLSIGSMRANKGMAELVAAFQALLHAVTSEPDLKGLPLPLLLLRGQDELYSSKHYLPEGIAELLAAGHVRYDGGTVSFARMASFHQAADAYVSPYHAEGFNLPVLEAAASGLPVIVSSGGSTDDFTHASFALRVKTQRQGVSYRGMPGWQLLPDVNHLASLMLQVMRDDAWRTSANSAGPAFVSAFYSWRSVTDEVLQLVRHSHKELVDVVDAGVGQDREVALAASNAAVERGNVGRARRVWAEHCHSVKPAAAPVGQPGVGVCHHAAQAVLNGTRQLQLCGCMLRAATLVAPIVGARGGGNEEYKSAEDYRLAFADDARTSVAHTMRALEQVERCAEDALTDLLDADEAAGAAGCSQVHQGWQWEGDVPREAASLQRAATTSVGGFLVTPNPFLLYQGVDVHDYMTQTARVYNTLYGPLLRTSASALPPWSPSDGPLRIGFLSPNLYHHSTGKALAGIIGSLASIPELFKVYVFNAGTRLDFERRRRSGDVIVQYLLQSAVKIVQLENAQHQQNITAAQLKLKRRKLHALVWADATLQPFSYLLAFGRYAPVQCAFWGASSTTGLDTIDYYLGGEAHLGVDSTTTDAPRWAQHGRLVEEQYREQWVALDEVGARLFEPKFPPLPPRPRAVLAERLQLHLREHVALFVCPQTLAKVHPTFDAMLIQLLHRNANSAVVFLEGLGSAWAATLRQRFDAVGIPASRVKILPRLPAHDYALLVGAATALLDTFPYSGFVTSVEALTMSVPVVTMRTATLRGSQTAALYSIMNMTELVCYDEPCYVDVANRLAVDSAFRARMQGRIRENIGKLFSASGRAAGSWAAFFQRATVLATHVVG